jgi:ribosome recycling factor
MLWKEHESAIKKADELEAILKAEREIRITKEYQERGANFPNIGTAEVVGGILKKAYEVSAEYGLQLENSLKDANAKIEKSNLFKEIGSDATSTNDGSWAKIEELAKSYVAKGDGQTMAQAIDRVLAENPKLYEEYTRERSGK